MSNPSFNQFLSTLRTQLRIKAGWLADESVALDRTLRNYGIALELSTADIRQLQVAAYMKNLGAIYLDSAVLCEQLPSPLLQSALKTWQLLSLEIAKASEMDAVVTILEQHAQRRSPDDRLASVFQVVNAWVACMTPKGYRAPMTASEAKATLLQRVELGWSDRAVVDHFLQTLNR